MKTHHMAHKTKSDRKTSDEIYAELVERQQNQQGILLKRLKSHMRESGVNENGGSERRVTPPPANVLRKDDVERIPTYFSTLDKSFVFLHANKDGEIPTLPWLEACEGPKDLLTGLGSIMQKVWADVGGNIETIQNKYNSNPAQFSTLQLIVYEDIENGVAGNDGSAAMAVLWLKRAFDFVAEFFDNIRQGQDPPAAASKAYEVTLSPHHAFYVRPMFYGAMRMLGSKQDILSAMALDVEDLDRSAFEQSAFEDIEEYTLALRVLLKNLDNFLTENNLNS